ncbi:methylenetetrahydrofolate reductase [Candidatus Palauibacter sp.]|uniref:methylenetetrahydrofolate reductase n=1 Tax=Candidatus Palauibacter sp. TaxID=3101350 RepID=UPI003B024911
MPPPAETRIRAALRDLALGASVEVPARKVPPPGVLAGHLPRGAAVYVPFPSKGRWPDTIAACERVLAADMKPVPHLSARSMRSRDELGDWLSALVETGVDSLMLVAGDRAAPAGPYSDTPALLDSGLLAEHGLRRLGVTSYPEGHPLVGPVDLDEALRRKTEYARATDSELWLVTQFVFSPAPALAWLARTREAGCTLPVRIGVPGPVALRTLIGYAIRCGVGASARALRRTPEVARLAGRWSPTPIARELAAHLPDRGEAPGVRERVPAVDIHLYTFGGLADAAAWLSRSCTGHR